MKLSVAWLFDHISQNWKDINISEMIAQFGAKVAEVDSLEHIKIDLDKFTLVKVTGISDNGIKVHSFELKKDFILPDRKDALLDNIYLLKNDNKNYIWAQLSDLGSEKEGLLTCVWCSESDLKGKWKDSFESEDYIITIDNKALTNRPDMWGHRGIAREVAAIINKDLRPEEEFLSSIPIKHYAHISNSSVNNPFILEISQDNGSCANACKRLSGLYIESINYKNSSIWMATRLARVDAKPLNFLVDTTNYVMYDIGQPMHAFDANTIKTHKIIAKCAKDGEFLKLLDGTNIELTTNDLIISDGIKPLALAGIMGGAESSITKDSKSLFIESANFDASKIRKTAAYFKKRTESSTRFEKNLDPNQNTQAILRYIKILSDFKIDYKSSDSIISIGDLAQEKIIKLSHDLIVSKLGIHINSELIESILKKIGFGVQSSYDKSQIIYTITIPTYRATKDISISEDIVEEIARFVGYEKIPQNPPTRLMIPFSINDVTKVRTIKHQMAYGLNMHEVQTYAFYDEEFLKKINYDPQDTLRIANPLSEHWQRLVTSLVPNLLKCVMANNSKEDSLNFFEYNRVWYMQDQTQPIERVELAGIFYKDKKAVDFYEFKELLNSLFNLLKLEVRWSKSDNIDDWYNKNQTADIFYQDRIIGHAGKISPKMLKYLESNGDAFIFELDANFLVNFVPVVKKFASLAKYQETYLDISLLISQDLLSDKIQNIILNSDKRIKDVKLIDFFEKSEWGNKKSVTYRFLVGDDQKTMTKEEIDVVWDSVVNSLKKIGAEIR